MAVNMQEFREYCSHGAFLRNLQENKIQTIKMNRDDVHKAMVLSSKFYLLIELVIGEEKR